MDPVTSLPDRWEFRQRLYSEIHRALRHGHSIGVFLIDLDDFHTQIRGLEEEHIAQLLVQVGEVIRTTLRKGDYVARISGDRFGALAQVASPADSQIVAERLRMAILEHRFFVKGDPIRLKASVGFVVTPEDGQTVDYLLSRAEYALARAKHKGKNQTEYLGRWDVPETFPPMIGRAEQIQQVETAIQQGTPLVVVRGGTGMGKTRFLSELREIFRNQGMTVLGPYPSPTVPYPLAPILGALIEEFRALNRPVTQEFGPTLPFFAPLFSDLGIPIPSIPGVPDTPTVSRRNLIFQTLTRLFSRLTRRSKVLLFIEDYERLDPDTIEFLDRLSIHGILGHGLHLILSAAPSTKVQLKSPALDIELPPFSVSETQALLATFLPFTDGVSPDQVWKVTRGHPLHLTLILAVFKASGEPHLPRSPKEALSRLKDALNRETWEVLSIAALTGEVIDDQGVAAFLSAPPSLVYEHLEKAKDLGFVHESDSRFYFVNAWTRSFLVRNIPIQRRVRIHRFFGEYYAQNASENALRALLASMHFRSARQWTRSLDMALMAADRLNEVMAASTAKAIYQSVLQKHKTRKRPLKILSISDLQFRYARLLHARYEWHEEQEILDQLIEGLNEEEQPRKLAELYIHIGLNVLLPQNRLTEAIQAAQKAYRFARTLREPDLVSDATYFMGLISLRRRKLDTATDALRTALSTAIRSQDTYRIGRTFLAKALTHLYRLELGSALRDLHAAARLFKKLPHPPQIAQVLATYAEYYRLKGDLEKALKNLQDALGVAEVTGDLKNEWKWLAEAGRVYATLGQFDEAHRCFEHSERILDILDVPQLRLYLLEQRLFTALRDHNLSQATRWVSHIQRLLQAHPQTESWASLALLWAEFHLLRDRPEQSQKLLNTIEPLLMQEDLHTWVHYQHLLARTFFLLGAPERAYPFIEQALRRLPKEIPAPDLWFTRYQIEQALNRPVGEIRTSLKRCVDDLMRMANAIKERSLRETFLERVESHRRILEEAQKIL